jgi:hypothetical protein
MGVYLPDTDSGVLQSGSIAVDHEAKALDKARDYQRHGASGHEPFVASTYGASSATLARTLGSAIGGLSIGLAAAVMIGSQSDWWHYGLAMIGGVVGAVLSMHDSHR